MALPSLTIIIPTYNGRQHLERCLPSVRRHAPHGTQVIVVDDASSDSTADWLRMQHPWVEMVALSRNAGFCQAVNAGLDCARGEIVELLNNDTEVCAGWVEAALPHFADPRVGSVAPLVLWMDRPEIIDSAGQDYHICGWAQNRGYGQTLRPAHEVTRDVFGASGSSGFYRRSALERTGGLLPEYGAYFEDVDLSFRLRWAGYRCIYEPKSRVLHKGSASYGQQPDRLVHLLSRNEELVYWVNLSASQLLVGLLPHLGFLAVRVMRKLLGGQIGPYLSGKRQAFSLWRQVLQRRRELLALARGGRKIDLAVTRSPQVLRQGLVWLRQRKCA